MIGLREPDNSRGDQCHGGVAEMTQQSLQPAAARHDIGVHEGDEAGVARGQAGITGCGGTSALRVPHDLDVAMRTCEVFLLDRRRRAVVHHDDPQTTQRENQTS